MEGQENSNPPGPPGERQLLRRHDSAMDLTFLQLKLDCDSNLENDKSSDETLSPLFLEETFHVNSSTQLGPSNEERGQAIIKGEGNLKPKKWVIAKKYPDTQFSTLTFTELPTKTLIHLFLNLETCTATCLALTNKAMYATFKTIHPGKISLWEICQTGLEETQDNANLPRISSSITGYRLGDLLRDWIGPRYRPRAFGQIHYPYRNLWSAPYYVSVGVYGLNEGSEKELILLRRYSDYANCLVQEQSGEFKPILPNPFNNGKSWYKEAKKAIIQDADRRVDWAAWMTYWNGSFVFKKLNYARKLRVLQHLELKQKEREQGAVFRIEALAVLGIELCIRTHTRFICWWVGDLPELAPFPEPIRHGRSVKRSSMGKEVLHQLSLSVSRTSYKNYI